MRFTERTAQHREVLAEDKHFPAVDGSVAGDHAIAEKFLLLAQAAAAPDLEDIELLKGAIVQQQIQPLPRRQLALAMLIIFLPLPAGGYRFRAQSFQCLEGRFVLSIHDRHLVAEPAPDRMPGSGSQFFISLPGSRPASHRHSSPDVLRIFLFFGRDN